MKRWLKQLFCRHWYQHHLVLCSAPNTHHDVKTCIKCGKSSTLFSGTRQAWYKRHGI